MESGDVRIAHGKGISTPELKLCIYVIYDVFRNPMEYAHAASKNPAINN